MFTVVSKYLYEIELLNKEFCPEEKNTHTLIHYFEMAGLFDARAN